MSPRGILPPAALQGENLPLTSIRGVAALAVFLCHVGLNFRATLPPGLGYALLFGGAGVDLFFVLSGFILTQIYAELQPAGWAGFWIKRVMRVMPLNLVLLSALALISLAGLARFTATPWADLPWHVLMLQSFMPHPRLGWLIVSWSVGVEMLCYLAFPMVVLLARLLPRQLLPVLAVLLLLLVTANQTIVFGQSFGLAALQRGAGGFALGCVLACLAAHYPPGPRASRALQAAGIMLLLLLPLTLPAPMTLPMTLRLALSVPGSAALVLGLAGGQSALARALCRAPWVWLGRVSYGLYLVHTLILLRIAASLREAGQSGPITAIAGSVLALGVSLMLAALLHRAVEVPGRRLGAQLAARIPRRAGVLHR